MQGGVLAGYEMVDVKVVAVRRQLSRCRLERNGVQDRRIDGLQGSSAQGQAGLLEPVMAVEVTVPEEYMGTIIGDLNSRRGRIEGMEMVGGLRRSSRRRFR